MHSGKSVDQTKVKETRDILNNILTDKVGQSPFINFLIAALSDAGCDLKPDIHIAIENCDENVYGAFDSFNNQIVLCQNKLDNEYSAAFKASKIRYLLSHELVHAYDHCTADIDFYNNPDHVMCSEIRAASLSGECMFRQNILRSTFSGLKAFHQQCVRRTALESFQVLHPNWTNEESQALATKVFPSCYRDHSPFDRIPLTKKQAELSFKHYCKEKRYKV